MGTNVVDRQSPGADGNSGDIDEKFQQMRKKGRHGRRPAQLTPRVCRSAHRSRRRISPPQATTSSGASIVSITLLPSRWHSIAQMMQTTMTRTHQSLRIRSSSLSSGSICGPVKMPRRSGAVVGYRERQERRPETADHRRRGSRRTRGPMTRPSHRAKTRRPRTRRRQSYRGLPAWSIADDGGSPVRSPHLGTPAAGRRICSNPVPQFR
jgi:hypothetical protein